MIVNNNYNDPSPDYPGSSSQGPHSWTDTDTKDVFRDESKDTIAQTLPLAQSTLRHQPSNGSALTGNRLTSYVDENYNVYRPQPHNTSDTSLVANAAAPAGHRSSNYQDLEYAEPGGEDSHAIPSKGKTSPFARIMGSEGRYPLEQRIEDKKRGIGRQKTPYVVWTLTAIMVAVFIYECVVQWRAQGSPVSFKPVVNPMLGPSQIALVKLGGRFTPCMKPFEPSLLDVPIGCPSNVDNPPSILCTLESVCSFGGFKGNPPNQWFRFITPIFLHAGFIHLLLNMFAQMVLSAQIERDMGSVPFLIMYMAAGTFGNVLGGNFILNTSVGASGAIFGSIAATWINLLAHWKYTYRPVRQLVILTIELVVGFAIGYIPYLDNFAHIGGFVMGLLVSAVVYPVISATKRHKIITWAIRPIALFAAVLLFVLLTKNFYTSDPNAACPGCKFLSCFPTEANNRCNYNGFTTTTTTTTSP